MRDPFPTFDELDDEPPTRPSTPSSLHPYRAASERPPGESVAPVIVPPRRSSHPEQSEELRRWLREIARTHDVSPRPVVDSWPRALLRLFGF